jgi:uncharacterized membrane protein YccC
MAAPAPPTRPRFAFRRPHWGELRLALRVTVAATLALASAQVLGLPLPLWAVLTAMVVTQLSVGRSLKATIDYLAGTVGGAVFGTVIAVAIPHAGEPGVLIVLALAVAPLSLIAAMAPRFTIAPATAVIVILLPMTTHSTSLVSALDRVMEVILGGGIGLMVSFLIVPSNAHRLAIETAAATLEQMALAFAALFQGLERGLDRPALHLAQDHIGQALGRLETLGAEAERERTARLAREPVIRPLLTCLLRLRHDLVMIGRVAFTPLPDALRERLRGPLATVETAITGHLRDAGAAILARRGPPSADTVESALAAFAAEVTTLRAQRMTAPLTDDEAERFFALGFVLEQMHADFHDLAVQVREWAMAEGD